MFSTKIIVKDFQKKKLILTPLTFSKSMKLKKCWMFHIVRLKVSLLLNCI